MKREIILTSDGSHTVQISDMNVVYHSHHGAIQESLHVFIQAGFLYQLSHLQQQEKPIAVFEMGFGTGLNALLTLCEAEQQQRQVYYTAIERFPLSIDETLLLNYSHLLGIETGHLEQLHSTAWKEDVVIHPCFTLRKIQDDLLNYRSSTQFHLIYYDAFAPAAQPELWTADVFKLLYKMLLPQGILVTYCSKGNVRRAMQEAGFIVEKIPGPRGKREMVRAEK